MKTYNKARIVKFGEYFDNELKRILSDEIKAFTQKSAFLLSNKQAIVPHLPTVA
jgi:hypothetical protein